MNHGHSLIDAAVKVCGSRYQLAKRVGVSQAYLSMVYSGERVLAPLTAAKIAAEAGLDASKAMAVAAIENEKDPEEREALKRVFFRAGTPAMLLFFIVGAWIGLSPTTAEAALPSRDALVTSLEHGQSVYYVN